MRVALVNAPLLSAVCDHGVGHQMPLGLLMVGGALRGRAAVTLIDAARDHLTDDDIVRRVAAWGADVAMVAHVGSTQAHPCCLRTMAALKAALPGIVTVYGGVHPTYHARDILAQHPEVDVIVSGGGGDGGRAGRGAGPRGFSAWPLSGVAGIAWRPAGQVVLNPARAPLAHLDAYPIAWDLVDDWDRYRAFGLGRAAVMQFSCGCPHSCTYCGQWMFWRRWRYRDVTRFVDELEWLRRERDVRFARLLSWKYDYGASSLDAILQPPRLVALSTVESRSRSLHHSAESKDESGLLQQPFNRLTQDEGRAIMRPAWVGGDVVPTSSSSSAWHAIDGERPSTCS